MTTKPIIDVAAIYETGMEFCSTKESNNWHARLRRGNVGMGYHVSPQDIEVIDKSLSYGHVISAGSPTWHGVRTPEGIVGDWWHNVATYIAKVTNGDIVPSLEAWKKHTNGVSHP